MSERLLVSTRKGLFIYERSGKGWKLDRTSFLGDNVTISRYDPRSGLMYAVLDHGHFGVKLHRSADEGRTWSEIAVPVYPEPPEGHVEKDFFGREIPWSLKAIWALTPGGPGQEGVLWCGTMPGAVFKSHDNGDSWEIVDSLWRDPLREKWGGGGADYPVAHVILLHPDDPDRVYVGVSSGGLWMTLDGGATWEVRGQGLRSDYMPPEHAYDKHVQDVHCLAMSRNQPDKMWVQHHNGIFRSVDGGATFTEIEEAGPSVFGFPVLTHPDDGDTAWFVPAVKDEKRYPVSGRVVVTRTRDGAKTFETLTGGLPQEHAYDLVYRHAFDLDETGDRLAMGSTTGSLWVSEDQGDSWSHLAAHLPPVYSVRFW